MRDLLPAWRRRVTFPCIRGKLAADELDWVQRMPRRKTREAGSPTWYQAGLGHVWLPYAQMKTMRPPLAVARTDGCRIVLADGRELIDGTASWWTACHGYNHPHIQEAIERQLAIMPHVMFGGLAHEQALTLARRLAALLPGDLDRVFFSDSGSVAVEVAMKMAVQYWLNRGLRGRTKFVAFRGGYHGDTTGAMAVCDPEEGMHALFSGLLPQHFIVDLPESEESSAVLTRLLERHADDIAGIIVALWLTMRRWRDRGGNPEHVWDIGGWAIIFGIVGGRLFYLLEHSGPLIGTTGFTFDGGVILAVVLLFAYAWRRRISARYLDAIAVGLPFGVAIGRLGDVITRGSGGCPIAWRDGRHPGSMKRNLSSAYPGLRIVR